MQSHFKYNGTGAGNDPADDVEEDDIYPGNVNWPLEADGTTEDDATKTNGIFTFITALTAGKAYAECIII